MTIAEQYIKALHHRGLPAKPRQETPYSDDPYNMSRGEYLRIKQRIKAKYKEKNRAAQKKLTHTAIAAIRRKPQKWMGYREQKKKELADLETKYRRAEIDRRYGSVPGAWMEDERGKYPVGTQGKPKAQRGRPPQYAPPRPALPAPPSYDVDAEWQEYEEPRGYLPPAPAPSTSYPRRALPAPEPSRRALPAPQRPQLPPANVPSPSRVALPPGKRPVSGYLPPAGGGTVAKLAKRVKDRRGKRR